MKRTICTNPERLLDRLDRHAAERARMAALVIDDHVSTWADIADASRRSSAEIRTKSPENGLVVVVGSSGAGLWIEVTAALRAGRRAMLVPPRVPDRALDEIASTFPPDLVRSSRAADGEHERARFEAARARADAPLERSSESAPTGVLIFSSGTTGGPRAIVRSAAALDRVAATLEHELGLTPRDRILSYLPMQHAYGLEHALLAPIMSGATVIEGSLAELGAAGAVRSTPVHLDRSITMLPATPFLLEALAAAPQAHALRRVLSAGAALPPTVAARFERAWGVRPDDFYGASELGTIAISSPHGMRVARGVEVRIVDPDRHEALVDRPPGTSGEVAVRSDAMFDGYVDGRGALPRRERTIDGFFRTGDLGALDEHGLRLLGRLKLQYDVGGLKVDAEAVERVLESLPGVARAVVLPMTVTAALTRLRAFIEPTKGASPVREELARLARGALAAHEVPRDFEFVAVMPRSPSGKLLRRALLERSAALDRAAHRPP